MSDLLARIERRAALFALAAMLLAWLVPGGGPRMAAGVAGGALLAFVSFWAIKRGVGGMADAVMGAMAPVGPTEGADVTASREMSQAARRRGAVRGLAAFAARAALLAGIAYVMIARLRLPPVGLLSGASVMMLAVTAELLRGSRRL
jgi:hypothetical protein